MSKQIVVRRFEWSDLNALVECYCNGGIWSDFPWDEDRKCPQCPKGQNNFGATFEGQTCPQCGSKLEAFWKLDEVREEIKTQLSIPGAIGFVAWNGNQIVGFTWGYPVDLVFRGFSYYIPQLKLKIPLTLTLMIKVLKSTGFRTKTSIFYIDEVGVHADFRNNGIATQLTTTLMKAVQETQLEFVFLRTDRRAKEAVRLYEQKLGFRRDINLNDPVHEHRGYWYKVLSKIPPHHEWER